MRVFTAVRHSNNSAYFYGGLWSGNFYPALHEMGHEVVESQVDLLPTSQFMHIMGDFTPEELEVRAQTTDKIIDEVARAHKQKTVDVFLSYFYNAHFDPSGFDVLRRLGIPSINFYCNSIYQFDYVAAIAAKADFSWHPEKDARSFYINAGANPVWVQMAADPNVYRPVKDAARAADCCFAGQRYADRDRWMAALAKAGVPIVIYGSGWGASSKASTGGNGVRAKLTEYLGRHSSPPGSLHSYFNVIRDNIRSLGLSGGISRSVSQFQYRRESRRLGPLLSPFAKGAIPFHRYLEAFSSHEVILNFSNVWGDGRPGSKLVPHVRLRDFEAPMCRTCYLTGYTDEIVEFYQPEREIITYRSELELVDKAKYYLAHPAQAEQVREAGYKRAIAEHTWVRRFNVLFSTVGVGR